MLTPTMREDSSFTLVQSAVTPPSCCSHTGGEAFHGLGLFLIEAPYPKSSHIQIACKQKTILFHSLLTMYESDKGRGGAKHPPLRYRAAPLPPLNE